MSTIIQQKRGTASQWTASSYILSSGEFGWETDTNRFKIGNGTAAWSALPYASPALGQGIPSGGTAGQVLTKNSTTDYDTIWSDTTTSQVKQYVKNGNGTTLYKGQAVYVTGASGANVLIGLAKADTEATSSKTIGLLMQDLAPNAFGYVMTDGTLTGLDTTGATTEGDPVWLSPSTAGGLIYGLTNKPYGPSHLVYIGVVTRKNLNNGAILVKVQNGFELQEIHNVGIGYSSTPSNNDLLTYESSTSVWKNKSFSTLGLATSSYVDTSIANLVASAPSTLDTLNELAAALGNDASFASTVTTSIAGKVSLTGSYTNPSWLVSIPFSKLTSTPTTLSGYGITDALTSATAASTYLTISNAATTYQPIGSYLTSVPTASSTVLGLTKLFSDTVQSVEANTVSSTASRTYGIQLNSSNQAVVNIPWTDTVYSLPTASATVLGGVKVGTNLSIDGSGVLSGTYSYTLPDATNAVKGGVIVGSTLSVSAGTINLPTTGVTATSYTSANITVDSYGRITAASNGSGFSGAGSSVTSVQSAAGVALPISTANNTAASGAITISTGTTSTTSATSGSVTINTGAGTGTGNNSGTITIQTGAGSGSTGNSGGITIDAGAFSGTGTAGTISIGGTNASSLAIGRSLATTTLNGTINIPNTFQLAGTSVTTTATKLNYLTSATGTTGTANTNIVFSTSPTFATSVIGSASMDVFNTVSTTINAFGAATSLTIGNTSSSGAKSITIQPNASTGTGTINIGTGTISTGSININIGTATGTGTVTNTIGSSTSTTTIAGTVINSGDGVILKTASFTVGAGERNYNVTGTASVTVTLPTATVGRTINIVNKAAFAIVSASSNVYPRTTNTLGTAICAASAGSWATLVADGTNWYIMAGA